MLKMTLTEGNFQREFVMKAFMIHDNHLIKVETREEGGMSGMMNSNSMEEPHLGCDQGETVVQWVVEMKEEEDVQFESAEENDPLCVPQSDQLLDGGFGRPSCPRKTSKKVKKQNSPKVKVTPSRKERGRRERHSSSLEDDDKVDRLQGK